MSQKQTFQGQHTQEKVYNQLLKNDGWLAGSIVPQGQTHLVHILEGETHCPQGMMGGLSRHKVSWSFTFVAVCVMFQSSIPQ